jgi:hypothetical protein
MSDIARVRRAYEVAHLASAARGLAIASVVIVAAAALHRTSNTSWLVAVALAAGLAMLAWRGGAWRRGAFAGVIAGLPPLIVPTLVIALSNPAVHCDGCATTPMWWCTLSCFAASSIVGAFVGHRASIDRSPVRFAAAALTTASFTGLLGCGTIGLGGAAGVVIGLVAGGVTGMIALHAHRPNV